MLEGMESQVSKVSGDGAYDAEECWDFCHSHGIKGILPPRKGAKIKKHGNCKGEALPRDEHIRMIRRIGKKMEEKERIQSSFYSRNSHV